MKIALLGANGQLGSDLVNSLTGCAVVPFTREQFDVTDHAATRSALLDVKPDVIINTTAYHRVDDCEDRPELAFSANVLAVLNLVRIANEAGGQLVHFSTDYVFDGNSSIPYTETIMPKPLSVYGNSKLAGEYVVLGMAQRHMVIRTCGLFGVAGSRGKGGNFVETMLAKARSGDSIRVVADQVLTPTYTSDLAGQVAQMIETEQHGLFHVTNEGACSWHEFAEAVFQLAGVSANLLPTTSDLYKTPATRPKYSVLENERLKKLQLNRMRDWREALAAYLVEKKEPEWMNTRKLSALPYVILLLPLDVLVASCLAIAVIVAAIRARTTQREISGLGSRIPSRPKRLATIQILNWDGKHLLEECLPSVVEAVRASGEAHRILVVDNGSSDGSAQFVAERFPDVRLLQLDRNHGFVGGNNRGVATIDTDIVVLLNNDMVVARDFLGPLLTGFADDSVFAVTSQIFFEDQSRRREETGKTAPASTEDSSPSGTLTWTPPTKRRSTIPVFWAGGGSCAFDRRKYEEIGGLDSLYHPFYVEDTDLSYQAWKRGWKCLLAPASRVIHKHRATAGRKYGHRFVDNTIRRNTYLFIWKNITDAAMTMEHVARLPWIHGRSAMQTDGWFEARAYARAVMRLPKAMSRRLGNLYYYRVSDREVQVRSRQ